MNFDEGKSAEKTGKVLGFLLMYLVFTAVAYFIFSYTGKIPEAWGYFHMMPFTLAVILAGFLVMKLLDR